MKTLHYYLNASLDDLSYHHESVKILTRTLSALNQNPARVVGYTYIHGGSSNNHIMYTILSAEMQEVVDIDVMDMVSRILTEFVDCVSTDAYDADHDMTDTTYDRICALEKFIKSVLPQTTLYWFEVSPELYPSYWEAYFKRKKVWASNMTDVHRAMCVLSVLNDINKYQRTIAEDDVNAMSAYQRYQLPPSLVTPIFLSATWTRLRPSFRSVNDWILGTSFRIIDAYYNAPEMLLYDELDLTESDYDGGVARSAIEREVAALLTVMPLQFDGERELVTKVEAM